MITTLTRRQKEVLRRLQRGERCLASYEGGDPKETENWSFALWPENCVEECSLTARTLIDLDLAKIAGPDHLGYRFLVAT